MNAYIDFKYLVIIEMVLNFKKIILRYSKSFRSPINIYIGIKKETVKRKWTIEKLNKNYTHNQSSLNIRQEGNPRPVIYSMLD